MELTDSVTRLYSAYFLRTPDADGFQFWADRFSQGGWNLDRISRFFTESAEFQARYGDLDDGEFVDLVYNNVMGRAPDAAGQEYWTGRLAGGLSRGTMMIFFSESEEFVHKTETVTPLAGYLRWYPPGTRFACGFGPVSSGRLGAGDYYDLKIVNLTLSDSWLSIGIHDRGGWHTVVGESLPAGYFWFAKNNRYGFIDGHSIRVAEGVAWMIVEYPTPMPDDRPGWGFLHRSTDQTLVDDQSMVPQSFNGASAAVTTAFPNRLTSPHRHPTQTARPGD